MSDNNTPNKKYKLANTATLCCFDDSCQVRTPASNFTFEGGGELFAAIDATLGAKEFEKDDFVSCAKDYFEREGDAQKLFDFLVARHILSESDGLGSNPSLYQSTLEFRAKAYPDDPLLGQALSADKVYVDGNKPYFEGIRTLLIASGVKVVAESEQATLIVSADCSEGYAGQLDDNERLYSSGKPYLMVKVNRTTLWLGPLVIPGQTPCFACLHKRMQINALHKKEFMGLTRLRKGSDAVLQEDPVVCHFLAGTVLNEVRKLQFGNLALSVIGAVIEIDLLNYESVRRDIVRVPRCEVCSEYHKKPVAALRDAV